MGSGGCINELEGCKLQSQKCLGKFDKASVLAKQKVAAEQPLKLLTKKIASLGPITPNADRENGDIILKKLSTVTCFNINTNADGSSPRTPVEDVFDPFAPGPDGLVLAPRCEKFVSKYSSVVVRQLNFDSPVQSSEDEMWTDVESISDEEMFEAVYENLLEAIVSKQTEGAFALRSTKDWDSDDCKTPSPEPRSIAAADSCPGAPMRPSGKSRDIDSSLIRKLQF